MKALILIVSLMLATSTSTVMAASKKRPKKSNSSLSRDMRFDDMVVRGKYQFADEAVAQVEDDKLLDDLLGLRRHFKDRIKQSTLRQ